MLPGFIFFLMGSLVDDQIGWVGFGDRLREEVENVQQQQQTTVKVFPDSINGEKGYKSQREYAGKYQLF